MRILAFDHFFEHDLQSLKEGLDRRADGPDAAAADMLDVVPYRRLHRVARRHFPDRAFAGLEGAFDPALAGNWVRFRREADGFADWLAAAYRPEVFVVPNDTFFYLRPVIERLRVLGVPTVCVQKETTIAPFTMDEESQVIRRLVPPISVAMAVCSERHREFAIRCGADPASVTVTGQPRFDMYALARRTGPPGGPPPSILFLSFDDLAYLPPDAESSGLGTWRPLRQEVERVLARLADTGAWRVVAKTHPQQLALEDQLGPRVERAPRGADTRKLIAESDVVVGFQTTALFEAAMAGRPVLYVAWGPAYEATLPLLIPFHEHPEMATRVASASELADKLAAGDPRALPIPGVAGRAWAEEHLGPIDGSATERVLRIVRAHAGEGPKVTPRPSPLALVPPVARGLLAPVMRLAGAGLAAADREAVSGACRRRAVEWAQEAREAQTVIFRRRR